VNRAAHSKQNHLAGAKVFPNTDRITRDHMRYQKTRFKQEVILETKHQIGKYCKIKTRTKTPRQKFELERKECGQ